MDNHIHIQIHQEYRLQNHNGYLKRRQLARQAQATKVLHFDAIIKTVNGILAKGSQLKLLRAVRTSR